MESDKTDELTRAEFKAAANYVESASVEEFTNRFEDFYVQLVEYDPSSEALILQFKIDTEDGIENWRMQRMDPSLDGDMYDKQLDKTHFRDDDGEIINRMGVNVVTIHIAMVDIEPDDLREILKQTFKIGSEYPKPSLILNSPDAAFQATLKDGSVSVRLV